MTFLSIIIPAYNEELRLGKTLDAICAYFRAGESFEIVVVDDGSTDRTCEIVASYSGKPVRLVKNPGNRGKGYAVRHGMLEAGGEWRLLTDADLSTPIEDVRTLLCAAEKAGAAIAFGSRALASSVIEVHQSAFREWSGRFFNLVMRTITGLDYKDTQCGFKLYRGSAAEVIFPQQVLDGFSFDVEDLVIAKKCGIPAVEVPVRWSNAEGSKVRTIQGLWSFVDLLHIQWNAARGKYRAQAASSAKR